MIKRAGWGGIPYLLFLYDAADRAEGEVVQRIFWWRFRRPLEVPGEGCGERAEAVLIGIPEIFGEVGEFFPDFPCLARMRILFKSFY
jgi:hypothetical protein